MIIDPKNIATKDLHQFLLGSVAPRPIAFVSTMDPDGNANLAPYSFFNAFSSNPPILVFSSNRRVANNTTKDTLYNVMETKEVVVNVVNYKIVRQMAITSVEYPADVSEFEKAGLTAVPADLVKPYRVKESPVNMECRVKDIITLGNHGGAGHLIICEVVRMHISDDIIDDRNRIDPNKIDLMGRMGRAFYVRASGPAVHTIFQKVTEVPIGYDALPESILKSEYLTANNLGQLAGQPSFPNDQAMEALSSEPTVQELLNHDNPLAALHQYARTLLDAGKEAEALSIVMLADQMAR